MTRARILFQNKIEKIIKEFVESRQIADKLSGNQDWDYRVGMYTSSYTFSLKGKKRKLDILIKGPGERKLRAELTFYANNFVNLENHPTILKQDWRKESEIKADGSKRDLIVVDVYKLDELFDLLILL